MSGIEETSVSFAVQAYPILAPGQGILLPGEVRDFDRRQCTQATVLHVQEQEVPSLESMPGVDQWKQEKMGPLHWDPPRHNGFWPAASGQLLDEQSSLEMFRLQGRGRAVFVVNDKGAHFVPAGKRLEGFLREQAINPAGITHVVIKCPEWLSPVEPIIFFQIYTIKKE